VKGEVRPRLGFSFADDTVACENGEFKIIHHRDPEFAEIRVFLDQGLLTLRPPRLCGAISEFFLTTKDAKSTK
jgi:hypothetical protein